MACSANVCKTVGPSELYVRCWICDEEFHGKCVGLTNSFTVGLRESSNNSRWSCTPCFKKTTEFAKLFRQCRAAFLEVAKDMTALQAKLSKYEDAFKTFSVLNNTSDSPPRKKKTLRSNSKNKNEATTNQLEPNGVEAMVVEDIQSSSTVPLLTVSTVDSQTVSPSFGPSVSQKSVSPSTSLSVSPKKLVAVAPRKTIFLSRLASDTSENDVIHYIKTKMNNDINEISVNKFNFKNPNRVTSSFKIFVPIDKFNILINNSFWPDNALVKEFIFRENHRNIATLPKN